MNTHQKGDVILGCLIVLVLVAGAVFAYTNSRIDNDIESNPAEGTSVVPAELATTTSSAAASTSASTQIQPIKVRAATAMEIAAAASSNNQFASDLFNRYNSNERGNIFFSPYSITTAIGMLHEGAAGKTAQEIEKVFHLTQNADSRRAAAASTYASLNAKNKPFTLKTANALWAQHGYEFIPQYLSTVTTYYKGNAINLDFVKNPEPSRLRINDWVEDQTNDRIKDLLPQGSITAGTGLVLTNAIYFKGNWNTKFEKTNTQKADFKKFGGEKVLVDMMYLPAAKTTLGYNETSDAQIVELPYEGDDLSMIIVLPKNENQNMTAFGVKAIEESEKTLNKQAVHVYLPKFTFSTSYSMAQDLSALGMPSSFTDAADFSGISTADQLAVTDVVHKAFVEVNEEGTEAAAATGIVVGVTSASEPRPVPLSKQIIRLSSRLKVVLPAIFFLWVE